MAIDLSNVEELTNTSPSINTSPNSNSKTPSSKGIKLDMNINEFSKFNSKSIEGTSTTINPEKYSEYMPGEAVYASQNIDLIRAKRQPVSEQILGFVNQSVIGEIIGGTIEGTGYLLDLPQYINLANGTEQEFANGLSDFGKSIKDWSKEATPIYETAPGTFNPGNSGWWFSNGVSVASTLSLLIPASGAIKGASMLVKVLVGGVRSGKLIKTLGATEKGTALLKSMDNAANMLSANKMVVRGAAQAVVSRHMENMMEASGMFEQKYNELRAEGFDEIEARQIASEGAQSIYNKNWAMLLQDIPQYIGIGSLSKMLTKGVSKPLATTANTLTGKPIVKELSKLGTVGALGIGAIGEGFEEAFQHIIQEEGVYISDLMSGKAQESTFGDRLPEYLQDGKLWTAALFGAIGGAAFQGVIGIKGSIDKLRGKSENTYEANQIEDIKSWGVKLATSKKRVDEAMATGNEELISQAIAQNTADMTLKAEFSGNGDIHRSYLESLLTLNQEEIDSYNQANPDAVMSKEFIEKYVPTMIEDSKNIEQLYKKNSKRYEGKEAVNLTYYQHFLYKNNQTKNRLSDEISKLESSIDLSTLSATGHELYSLTNKLHRKEALYKNLQEMLKAGVVNDDTRKKYNEVSQKLDNYIKVGYVKEKEEFTKSDTRDAETKAKDNLVFSAKDVLRQISIKQGALDHIDTQRELLNERIDNITDPVKRQKEKERVDLRNTTNAKIDAKFDASIEPLEDGTKGSDLLKTDKLPQTELTFNGERATIQYSPSGDYRVTVYDENGKPKGKSILIDSSNVDSLQIESIEERKQRVTEDQRFFDLSNRFETVVTLKQALVQDYKSNIEELNKINEQLLINQSIIDEQLVLLSIVKEDTTLDKRTKQVKNFVTEIENQIKTSKQAIEELNKLKDSLYKSKSALEAELVTISNEIKSISDEAATHIATGKITKENYEKQQEILNKYPEGFEDTFVNALGKTTDLITSIESQIEDLNHYIKYLEQWYQPLEVVKLLVEKDTQVKWFTNKYSDAPNSNDILENLRDKQRNPKKYIHLKNYIKKYPSFIEDLKSLEKTKKTTEQVEKQQQNVINSLLESRLKLLKLDKDLVEAKHTFNRIIENYNTVIEAKTIVSLYEKIAEVYANLEVNRIKEDLSQYSTETEHTLDNEPFNPITELPSKENEEEFYGAQKGVLNSTTGLHFTDAKNKILNTRELTRAWFNTLSKIPKFKLKDYRLQLVTSKTLPEAFSTEEIAFDEQLTAKGEPLTGFKAVLVRVKDSQYVRTDENGNIGKGNLLMSSNIHRSTYLIEGKLSERLYITAWGNEHEIPNLYKILTKEGKVTINENETYTKEELVNKIKAELAETHDLFREKVITSINTGNKVYVNITGISNGIPLRLAATDGKRNRQSITNFTKVEDIAQVHIPLKSTITVNGLRRKVVPGTVYIERKDGKLIDSIPRNLNSSEITMVQKLLYYALKGHEKENFSLKSEDGKYQYPIFSNEKGKPGLINSLILYGENNNKTQGYLKPYEIYFKKGKVYYGGAGAYVSIGQIMTDEKFKEFLGTLHATVKESMLSLQNYYEVKDFDLNTGTVTKGFVHKTENNQSGYVNYLVNSKKLGVDIVPTTQIQFASTYLTYDYKIQVEKSTTKSKKEIATPIPITETKIKIETLTDLRNVPNGAILVLEVADKKIKTEFQLLNNTFVKLSRTVDGVETGFNDTQAGLINIFELFLTNDTVALKDDVKNFEEILNTIGATMEIKQEHVNKSESKTESVQDLKDFINSSAETTTIDIPQISEDIQVETQTDKNCEVSTNSVKKSKKRNIKL